MNLNSCQREAIKAIMQAYQLGISPYALSGGPGTGKTVTVGEVVKRFKMQSLRIAVLASSNSAVVRLKEVASRDGWYGAVELFGTTHRGLGWYMQEDEETGNLETVESGNVRIARVDVVIVDEASMLNKEIVDALVEQSKFVLFVGDQYQLLPVGEERSHAFDGPLSELTQIMRNSDKERVSLIKSVLRRIKGEDSDVDLSSVCTNDLDEFQERLRSSPDSIALCFTNYEADRLNRVIRFKSGRVSEYEVGDRIIFTKSVYKYDHDRSKRYMAFSTNTIGIITAASKATIKGFKCWSLRVKSGWVEDYILVWDNEGDNLHWNEFLMETEPKKEWPRVASVKYGYAMTVHRSQGHEWDNVFVNVSNFDRCIDEETKNRLLYVSLSRSKDKLLCYTGGRNGLL